MKKHIYITLWVCCCALAAMAQNSQCPELGIRTNPDNPFETRTTPVDANGTVIFLNNGKFDWREPYYTWWKQVNNIWLTHQLNSPYTTINNPNLVGYIDNIPADNKPEDGWELVTYNFGKLYDGSLVQTDHPRFILYNRYTGILRIFYYYNMPLANNDYQTARIRLSYKTDRTGSTQSALLTYVEKEAVALDDFTKRLGYTNINELNITSGQWLVADFPMAYDPCTCLNEYDLLDITLDLVLQSTVTLTGRIVTSDNLTVSNKSKTGTFPGDYKVGLNSQLVNTANGFIEVIGQGQKNFKTMKEFRDNLNTLLGSEKSGNSKSAKTSAVSGFDQFLALEPRLGAAVGLINFFIGGGKTGGESNAAPITFDADIDIGGIVQTNVNAVHQYLVVPGSIPKPTYTTEYHPMYNEVLGIFNLLETPELEIVDYLYDRWSTCPGTFSSPPAVRHFKVTKPIQYAVNPAAHLEIEKFDATFTITYDAEDLHCIPAQDYFITPPFATTPLVPLAFNKHVFPRPFEEFANLSALTYEERLNRIGMGVETWDNNYPGSGQVVLNTTWLPVGAMQDQSFMLFRDAYYQNNSVNGCHHSDCRIADPVIRMKVHITFKRTDNPNAPKVTFVASFKVKFKQHPLMVTNPGAFMFVPEIGVPAPGDPSQIISLTPNPGPVFFVSANNLAPMGAEYFNFYRVPVDLEVSNTTLGPGTVQALHTITIGNNVTLAPGTILQAGKEITVASNNTVDPTVVMQLAYPTANAALNPEAIKTTDFSNICNNINKYNPVVPEAETAPPMPGAGKLPGNTALTSGFAIYPNPATTTATIAYSIRGTEEQVRLSVLDAMGKELVLLANNPHSQGDYTQTLIADKLAPGIYFCRLERNGQVEVKKFTLLR